MGSRHTEAIVRIARDEADRGVRENDGSNRDAGGRIRRYWGATWAKDEGWRKRWPYCCAFAVWVLREAGLRPYPTASCSRLVENALSVHDDRFVFVAPGAAPEPGDLALFDTKQAGAYNHVEVVVAAGSETFETVGANTSPGPGADPDNDPDDALAGVWGKVHRVRSSRVTGFVRVLDETAQGIDEIDEADEFVSAVEQEKRRERVAGMQQLVAMLGVADLDDDGIAGPLTAAAMRKLWEKVQRP